MTLRGVSSVGVLGEVGALEGVEPVPDMDLPLRGGRGGEQLRLVPDEMAAIARRIGDDRTQAVMRLRERGIVGTLPELLAYSWLERRGYGFEFQSSALGGRRQRGGAVIDFLIDGLSPSGWYVWRIQGEYWHQGIDVETKDAIQAERLRGMQLRGAPVVAVVDLWEDDIYDRYPQVFHLAELGEGLR